MSEVALVTGASSGIGAEFARQLSQRGYEVILVARREERMRELASQLQGPAQVVACDLARDAASLSDRVAALDRQVDVLVKNAGFGTHGHFAQIDPARDAEQVRLNCEEWQQVAGYEPGYLPPVPGKISAAQVAAESLRAFERGRRSLIPGPVFRWYMRINRPAPLPIKLRVVERMYRPGDGASSDRG